MEDQEKPTGQGCTPFALLAETQAACQGFCPVYLNCPGYLSLIKERKFEDAYRLIRQRLPFPRILGRICNRPCEKYCRRAQMDETIAIRNLKRFVGDYACDNQVVYVPAVKAKRQEKVAIVGSGPAGLSAAYDLAREGFKVTVFEALPVSGGMLAVGCPEYRLPRMVVEEELENVKRLGVEIKLNSKVTDINSLFKQGYKAIFIAVGSHNGRRLPIPGANLKDVLVATSFLRDTLLGKKLTPGKRVLVIGGGDVAFDCARTAVRLGSQVDVLCVESRLQMPADVTEINMAEEEGVKIHPSRMITRILDENGRVTGAEFANISRARFDKDNKLTAETIKGSEHILPADTVIFAVGQEPDISALSGVAGIIERNSLAADPDTLATKIPGVFAGGDAAFKTGSVIKAIANGQKAALSITAYLNGQAPSPRAKRLDDMLIAYSRELPTTEEIQQGKKLVSAAALPAEARRHTFDEAVLTYAREKAVEEARRCLRCDLEKPSEGVDYRRMAPSIDWSIKGQIEQIKKQRIIWPAEMLQRMVYHTMGIQHRRQEKGEYIFVPACAMMGMLLQGMSSMKLLDALGVDWTFIRGDYCCGMATLETGTGTVKDMEDAEKAVSEFAAHNMEQVRKAGGKWMLHLCQWCTYVGEKFKPKGFEDIEIHYFPDLLLEYQDKLKSLKPTLPPTKVGYYEGCHIRNNAFAPGVDIPWKKYRQLVELIDGVEITDLPHWKCCVQHHDQIVEDAQKMGLDCIVTPCAACWTWLERVGANKNFPVWLVQDILVIALGKKTFDGLYITGAEW